MTFVDLWDFSGTSASYTGPYIKTPKGQNVILQPEKRGSVYLVHIPTETIYQVREWSSEHLVLMRELNEPIIKMVRKALQVGT